MNNDPLSPRNIASGVIVAVLSTVVVGALYWAWSVATENVSKLPSPTSPAATQSAPSAPQASPTDAVTAYWEDVSNGRYQTAWSGLSPNFQQRMHNNSYTDYAKGYEDLKICSIETSNVKLVQQTTTEAVVDVHVVYRTSSDCAPHDYDFEISLVYDAGRQAWLYDKTVAK